MAGLQSNHSPDASTPPVFDADDEAALDASFDSVAWDDAREYDQDDAGVASAAWNHPGVSGKRARMRHAPKRPSLLLRATEVALACAAIAGLVGTAAYRLHAGAAPTGSRQPLTPAHVPPVITLFSPDGSTPGQNSNQTSAAAPLPTTTAAAPSQYLAPDKPSAYELSLIASVGTPDKAIVVSRFSQTIHVYQSGQFIAGSYAITGRPELPTPIGVYHIFLKIAPAVLYSPWPPGSPYYYAPAPVNYTMEFRAGGFLIHDDVNRCPPPKSNRTAAEASECRLWKPA